MSIEIVCSHHKKEVQATDSCADFVPVSEKKSVNPLERL